MFYVYRVELIHEEHPRLIHLADLETEKAVVEEIEKLGLCAEEVAVFTHKAKVNEEKKIWIENNRSK